MGERDIESIHIVGSKPDGVVWLYAVSPKVDVTDPRVRHMFQFIADLAEATLVGHLRCRREGDNLAYYSAFVNDPPSEAEDLCMQNGLLYVAASGTGHLDDSTIPKAQRIAEDCKTLSDLNFGEEA
jgi:hypothetical protein